jgi:membrane associated rhomboid family serine protease
MIIPLGHDQTEVRRLPWVTFTLMGLCILVHLLVTFGPGISETDIGKGLSEAVEFWMTHPYLELPQRLHEEMLSGFPEEEFNTWRVILEQNAGPPPAAGVIAQQQIELNTLVEQSFAGLEELPLRKYGLVPARTTILTLFTHMFLHVGWLHLLGNLFFLYLTGPFIEDVWGRPLFLGFYLLAGLASGGLFALRYADLTIPLVGASGAIAGCMGAFLIRYWHINIKFFYWIGFFFRGTFKAPAWLMLPLWLLRELFAATMMDSLDPGGRSGGTAFWAHVWGFLFGIGVALGIRFLRIEQRFIHHAIEAKTTVVNNAVVAEALEAQDAGKTDEALASLTSEVQRNPGNAEAVLALWGLAVGASRATEAAPALQRLLREEVRAGDFDLAMTHRAELAEFAPETSVEPAVELRLAEHLLNDEQQGQAAALLRNALAQVSPEVSPGMLTRLARLACRADGGIGLDALEAALAHPELPAEVREEFEGKKKELAARQPTAAPAGETFGGSATSDEGGISIPGFEPTSMTEWAADRNAVAMAASAMVPDIGGDAPVNPTAFGAFPEIPGFETTAYRDQEAWVTEVPPMGGDAPAKDPAAPGMEIEEPSWSTADPGAGIEIPGLGAGESLTAGSFVPSPVPDLDHLDPSSFALDPSLGGEPMTMDQVGEMELIPAVDQAAALGLEPASALAPEPVPLAMVEPDVVAPLEAPAAHQHTDHAAPAVGPASLRQAGTIAGPGHPPISHPPTRPAMPRKKLERHQAVPLSIDDQRMIFDVEGRGPSVLGLDKVQAVSAAVIRAPGKPASIVIDLLLDPPWATGARLRVVRMRSGRLDPSKVMPEAPNSAVALRMMIDKLLAASQGIPLPDTRAVKGSPFREFSSLGEYEREVLQAN